MKKIIYTLPVLFLGVMFLAGCSQITQTPNSLDATTGKTTSGTNTDTTKEVIDKEVKTGDEDIDKEINDIDKVFDSIDSADLEGDNLKDSELGM
jgi:PBP1b-binding outer membrane lipoprotein LpoB